MNCHKPLVWGVLFVCFARGVSFAGLESEADNTGPEKSIRETWSDPGSYHPRREHVFFLSGQGGPKRAFRASGGFPEYRFAGMVGPAEFGLRHGGYAPSPYIGLSHDWTHLSLAVESSLIPRRHGTHQIAAGSSLWQYGWLSVFGAFGLPALSLTDRRYWPEMAGGGFGVRQSVLGFDFDSQGGYFDNSTARRDWSCVDVAAGSLCNRPYIYSMLLLSVGATVRVEDFSLNIQLARIDRFWLDGLHNSSWMPQVYIQYFGVPGWKRASK